MTTAIIRLVSQIESENSSPTLYRQYREDIAIYRDIRFYPDKLLPDKFPTSFFQG